MLNQIHEYARVASVGLALMAFSGCMASDPSASGTFTPVGGSRSGAGDPQAYTSLGQASAFPVPDSGKLAGPAESADYRISPQDAIDVSVFQAPTLNRASIVVDGSGAIAFPLIGKVVVGGRTAREVESDIAARLNAKYVQSPQVTVFVKDAVGQRVTVDGAVKTPGVLQVKGRLTLLQAVAQSGGLSDTGDASAVMLFRTSGQQRLGGKFDLAAIRGGTSQDPPVYGGDMIIVDDSTARTAWKGIKEVLPIASLAATAAVL